MRIAAALTDLAIEDCGAKRGPDDEHELGAICERPITRTAG